MDDKIRKTLLYICRETLREARGALSTSDRGPIHYSMGRIDALTQVLDKLMELEEGDDHDDSA